MPGHQLPLKDKDNSFRANASETTTDKRSNACFVELTHPPDLLPSTLVIPPEWRISKHWLRRIKVLCGPGGGELTGITRCQKHAGLLT